MNDTPAQQAETILKAIKDLDRAHWSQPSNSIAIAVMNLEQEYEALTGRDCPQWPERKVTA